MTTERILTAGAIAATVLAAGTYLHGLTLPDDLRADAHDHDDGPVAPYEVYPGDVSTALDTGARPALLDVRTSDEYAAVHLDGAFLVPLETLSQQALAAVGLGPDKKDVLIYVYCHNGSRSKTAYNIMTGLGYTNVRSVAGGMVHWQEDGYPHTASGPYTGPSDAPVPQAVATDTPRLMVDHTTFDLGQVPQYGGPVFATFTLGNEGTAPLTIGELTTSCSCTSATVADRTVPAGSGTTLTVRFDPNFHAEPEGVFKRTVFVPTNDPRTPELDITISVDILEGK
jgi:rhodanese-related sulfurtransferase